MNTLQKRFILFLGGCIPMRLSLAALAKYLPNHLLPLLGYIMLIPAIGFLYLYMTGKRTTGLELFGQPIWWASLRIIHSILYFLFSYLAIMKNKQAYVVLFVDALLGFFFFMFHHYLVGDFLKLV